jgi:hypothetical protein
MEILVHRAPPTIQPISSVHVTFTVAEVQELLDRYPVGCFVASHTVETLVKRIREDK